MLFSQVINVAASQLGHSLWFTPSRISSTLASTTDAYSCVLVTRA